MQNFRSNLNDFLAEVLSKFVFDGVVQPDEGIVDTLASFVVNDTLPWKNKLSEFTSTPTVRSFVLKLLLHGQGYETAKTYLQKYLKTSGKLNGLEFQLLIIFCLEDRFGASLNTVII